MKKVCVCLFSFLIAIYLTACNHPAPPDVKDSSIAAIEAYIDQLMQTQEMKDSIEYCKANNMEHQLEARKDTFVYKYTYTVAVPANTKDLLNAQYASVKDAFAPIVESMKADVPAIKTVAWEYYTMDGTLITSFSF